MPQQDAVRVYSTFNKGLITEASPLTFPADASTNEDNCVLYYKGNRVRRLGIDFETSFSLSTFSKNVSQINQYAISEFRWRSVANTATDYLAIQFGSTVYFYNISGSPFSGNIEPYTVDLTAFTAPFSNSTNVAASPVAMSSGKGLLFITGSEIEPIVVTLDPVGHTLTPAQIYIQTRDFTGISDLLAPDDEPSTLSDKHRYNLKNQGWNTPTNNNANGTIFGVSSDPITGVSYFDYNGQPGTYSAPGDAPITKFETDQNKYPPNNKQWFVGINSSGGFDTGILRNYSAGNTYAPRGHYILNEFNKDRAAFCDPALSINPVVLNYRPVSCAFFAGRVWYLAGNTVYFSQVLDNARQVGMCFQAADPTDQSINQLVASDGGTIPIPEMGIGTKLFVAGTGLLVFSANGVWFIGGGSSNGFSATDFSVTKLSPIGVSSPNSVIAVDSDIYWWSDIGIQGISQKTGIFGPVQNNFDKLNLSDQTIKTFYFTQINDASKQYVKSAYDPATNTVVWLFKTTTNTDNYKYDRILNFDLTTKAFYPWTISSSNSQETPWICGVFVQPDIFVNTSQANDRRNTYLCFPTIVVRSGVYKLTFSHFSNDNFSDWFSDDSIGRNYTSYMETGYDLLAIPAGDKVSPDPLRKKVAPRLVVYFNRTEQNFVGSSGDYTLDKKSSCLLTVKWDWSSSTVANKWMGPFEVYRLSKVPYPDETNLAFDNGYPITIFREKIRGSGRAIQFRFESNGVGKDFNLFGWGVEYSTNVRL